MLIGDVCTGKLVVVVFTIVLGSGIFGIVNAVVVGVIFGFVVFAVFVGVIVFVALEVENELTVADFKGFLAGGISGTFG